MSSNAIQASADTGDQPGLAIFLDGINETFGRIVSWATLAMVIVQFIVVIMRYVFNVGSIPIQESILYYHGIVFLLGAGYTLKRDGHVRVDIFYREASPRRKATIDLFGVLIFLIPVCVMIMWFSWSFVINAWNILEGSQEPLGLHLVYLLKSLIIAFAVLVLLQGIALGVRSIYVLMGKLPNNLPPGTGEHPPEA